MKWSMSSRVETGVQLAFHIFILETSHLLAGYFRPKGEQNAFRSAATKRLPATRRVASRGSYFSISLLLLLSFFPTPKVFFLISYVSEGVSPAEETAYPS